MATAHEICSNCGAKLSAGEVGAVLRCEYCGTENRIEAEAPPPPPPPPSPRPRRAPRSTEGLSQASREAKGNTGLAIVGLLGVFAIGVVIFAIARRSSPSSTGTLSLSELHTASIVWNVDRPLDTPPMATSREHFDPLANLDWAGNIGRAWWPDAELKLIEADPIGKDGIVDLTRDGAKVTYDFYSAGCMADYQKRIETTPGVAETTCHLIIELGSKGTVVSMALIGRDRLETITHPPCKVSEAFARLSAAGKLAARPTYAFTLAGHDPIGWTVRAGAGSAPLQGSADLPYDFCHQP